MTENRKPSAALTTTPGGPEDSALTLAVIVAVLLAGWLSLIGIAGYLALSAGDHMGSIVEFLSVFSAHVSPEKALYSPLVYLALFTFVFLMEKKLPAVQQPLISVGLVHDFAWYVFRILVSILFMASYVALLQQFYDDYLGFLTIQSISTWPSPARFVTAM